MSRLAVQSNVSTNEYGASRIPRPHGHVAPSHDQTSYGVMQDSASSSGRKPSRLQQLQSDYQKQLIMEKESKMIEMYKQNQQKALQKVGGNNNNKGMLRDFFNERRNQGSAGSNSNTILSPSIDHAYRQKQMAHKSSQQPVNAFGYNPYSQQKQPSYKSSAGRDRSNPLAPIQKHGEQQNPFSNKPQIVRPKTYGKNLTNNKENRSNKEPMPRSAPTGNFVNDNDDLSDDSPLPNAKQLEALQQKRRLLQSRKSNKSMSSVQSRLDKPTDFQKFQNEQDNQRDDRLRRHRQNNGGTRRSVDDEGFGEEHDDSGNDEIKRKQAELLAQIEAQQKELDRIRQERVREEAEEKKERERRKRAEEERKRKQIEEDKRRRRQDEDDRIREQQEEERDRKLQEEKRRLRQSFEKPKFEYEESDEDEDAYEESGYNRHEPTPPPQPKPANNVQRRHPVPAKTKTTPKPPPPSTGGAHTALYEDADRLEGAIESVGRLKACNICGRKFAEDRVAKHEAACKKASKKRKVMDPTKVRTRGTEMAQYVNNKQPEPKPKKKNWRAQHENFVQSIRYARKMKQIEEQGGSLADLPPPPPTENPDYVQCQYCSRKFNAQTAERHIPHCKNTKARPNPVKRR